MIDSRALAEYSAELLRTSNSSELDQRLGLYRVFLKLYEHHRALLDEILDLENTSDKARNSTGLQYVQGVIQDQQIYLITNLLQGITQSVFQSQRIWAIGRDHGLALPIEETRLSRRHAVIQYLENQGFYLIDLSSTNGSFVNGEPVRYATPLNDGDQIRLGSLSFTFFVCHVARTSDVVPPELVEQIQALHNATDLTIPPSVEESPHNFIRTDIMEDAASDDDLKDTFLFLKKVK